ncbi:Putative flavin amine oxidase, FAD/NAD(P)-binding domain superfamily [Septoria linicola]|uniref:Amine oxidase n=1 Tax=Septoria linicola TaxID=215465 RepID=A0A9Q9AY83_9PEZI|nr:Putative flavin amine oxidase, FAD/NAD(P)-binding domain superfamily [Septoria linicola]
MKAVLLTAACLTESALAYVAQPRTEDAQCRQTTVAILGAGVAGITAAQALVNASVTDFVIIEANDYIGGRIANVDFGRQSNGDPHKVEIGANWVHGVGGNFVNPIYHLIEKYNINLVSPDYETHLTFNETGPITIDDLWDAYDEVSEEAIAEAGRLLTENVQDESTRTGLALAGWKPEIDDMAAALVEWVNFDWSIAVPPEDSSFIFGTTVENFTYGLFGEDEPFIVESRGYNTIVKGEASTFLHQTNDPRLLLNTTVTNITHSDTGVTIHSSDGTCISAAYAINTVSLGVLQHDSITYHPSLPLWKQTAIQSFGMTTYTKLFLQFNSSWWDPNNTNTEYFYYADPHQRGFYPVFQSLSTPKYLGSDSHILFATVTGSQPYRVERQSDAETQAEIMHVLQSMFPNVTIPEPTAFYYPRWTLTPNFRGSYSYWPPQVTLKSHQNLRGNVGRLLFCGGACEYAVLWVFAWELVFGEGDGAEGGGAVGEEGM